MQQVKLHLGYSGYCLAKENDAIKGGARKKIKFFALWGLIKHPTEGYILFDTGYTDRFFKETSSFPNKIYAMITQVKLTDEDAIVVQLRNSGIDPAEIKKVFISHFHADHVGGLCDFPDAEIIASKKALDYTLKLPKSKAFSKGVLKGLIPEDIHERVKYVENCKRVEDPIFGHAYDFFEDGTFMIYELPGHARGQCGVLIQTEKQKYFLISDACWLKQSYQEMVLPNPVVRLFFDSWSEFKDSLKKINKYHKENPDVVIIPTHCSATTDPLIAKTVSFEKL